MSEIFGIVTEEHCYLRKAPGSSDGRNENGIEDEIFSGWAVRIYPETEEKGWIKIDTHYGYKGYVRKCELRLTDAEEIWERQDKRSFYRIGISMADLLDCPKVQGLPGEYLLKSALVELLERDVAQGWCRIRTAAGREGYVHTRYLQERKDDDGYLLKIQASDSTLETRTFEEGIRGAVFGDEAYFRQHFLEHMPNEEVFRERAVKSAKEYLGVQYRWGGKSSQGLDCSGLVFMSYLENGVIIYRDAKIVPEYPVNAISRAELKKGDLIFFPGHVAMYLDGGKYIHSTAFQKTPYVTINSLNPSDEDYRDDLAKKITGCGSIFAGEHRKDSGYMGGNRI